MAVPQTTARVFFNGSFGANAIAKRPPTIANLTQWTFPRTSPAPANLVTGGSLTNMGGGAGPTLRSAWGDFAYNVTLASNLAYDTGAFDTASMTMAAVALAPGGGGGFSLFSNTTPNGVDVWLDQFANGFDVFINPATSFSYPVPGGSILNWGFYGVTIGPAGMTLYAPTVGIATQLTYLMTVTATGTLGSSTISVTITGAFTGSPKTKTYTSGGSDTTALMAAGLVALVNADTDLIAAGITAKQGNGGSYASKLAICQAPGGTATVSSAVSGGATVSGASTTSAHTPSSSKNVMVGSTVSGTGKGTGSLAWYALALNTQATQAQMTQLYQAIQSSLALDGINI